MPKRLRKDEKVDRLAALPLFESCSRRELGDIATIMVETERPAGTYLTREGQAGGVMFVIVEGEAEVLTGTGPSSGPGDARVVRVLRAGDPFGELSLIDGHSRSASVKARTDVRLLEIAADDFYKLVGRSPRFVRNLLRSLSVKVREMDALTA